MRTLCGSGVPLAMRRSDRAVPEGWLAYSSRSRAGRMPRVATLTASMSSEPVSLSQPANSSRPTWLDSSERQARSRRTGSPARADGVLPAEPGDEVAARVADGGAAELPDELDDVHAEPVLVRARVTGLVETGVHAAAEVFDERAEGAAPDRGDDGLPVEFDVGARQSGGPFTEMLRGWRMASGSGPPPPGDGAGAGLGRVVEVPSPARGPTTRPRTVRRGSWRWCQPFTAPVRPPTMRFSKTEKKIRAGSMASEVKARTFAVSVEYWEENTWTPSGRV